MNSSGIKKDAILKDIHVFESGLHMLLQSPHTPTTSLYNGTRRIGTQPASGIAMKKRTCTFIKGLIPPQIATSSQSQ